MNIDEKIELSRWLISRHDNLRSATASRSAIVLSADAVLLTLVVFLLDKTITRLQGFTLPSYAFLALIFVCMLLLVISMLHCLATATTIWKSSRQFVKYKNKSDRLYYNARDSIEYFIDTNAFIRAFKLLEKETELEYSLKEMWSSYCLYRLRYHHMRLAIKSFVLALLPLFVSITIYFWIVLRYHA